MWQWPELEQLPRHCPRLRPKLNAVLKSVSTAQDPTRNSLKTAPTARGEIGKQCTVRRTVGSESLLERRVDDPVESFELDAEHQVRIFRTCSRDVRTACNYSIPVS